mgnify:CR=1 FL=1
MTTNIACKLNIVAHLLLCVCLKFSTPTSHTASQEVPAGKARVRASPGYKPGLRSRSFARVVKGPRPERGQASSSKGRASRQQPTSPQINFGALSSAAKLAAQDNVF